ncbi:hypothetical protein [Natrinema sp. H-ect4]|uniref:hypothetical protein n=1 Tax=Natrinema sp. H-ect4 TaxID=3242699 RepID=UPI0035A8974A
MDTRSHDSSAVRSERGWGRARFGANAVSENRGNANGEQSEPGAITVTRTADVRSV